ncbi:hypothetical protein P7K49_023402 [Saguinus oedipus]|uniref:Uncharacterized protein n=1 Tax=Saguinus oedipus TaxID=9490 RepID=A0ABQ9ULI0_SAGOE|nr:hypothetical protein P7K49_023402 [Saguinus oedipus]
MLALQLMGERAEAGKDQLPTGAVQPASPGIAHLGLIDGVDDVGFLLLLQGRPELNFALTDPSNKVVTARSPQKGRRQPDTKHQKQHSETVTLTTTQQLPNAPKENSTAQLGRWFDCSLACNQHKAPDPESGSLMGRGFSECGQNKPCFTVQSFSPQQSSPRTTQGSCAPSWVQPAAAPASQGCSAHVLHKGVCAYG